MLYEVPANSEGDWDLQEERAVTSRVTAEDLSWEQKLEAGPCLHFCLLLFNLQFICIHIEHYAKHLVSE